MLHRIEVDEIDVTFEVSVIADGMLPKSSLPDFRFRASAPGSSISIAPQAVGGKSRF
jgi:hypothetical protein